MAHVFISYSRQDTPTIERLVRELETAAIEVWVDREGVMGGAKWRTQIVDAIQNAEALLVALSPASAASDNVRKELDIAEDFKKPVLPVEILPTLIPKDMVYQLVGLQRIDLATNFHIGVKRLVESIRLLVKAPEAFVRLSPQERNKIKELMSDPALSASDRLSRAGSILTKENNRTGEETVAELLRLDERAQKRINLRDKLRQGGSSLQRYVLDNEEEEDKLKRELILEQMEKRNKLRELAISQMQAVVATSGRLMKDFWGKPNPESR